MQKNAIHYSINANIREMLQKKQDFLRFWGGNLVEFFGETWGEIGVYEGKNGFWTLLNRRKMTKKRPIMRTFIQLLTIFIQQMRSF